jgi:hypothetical protein
MGSYRFPVLLFAKGVDEMVNDENQYREDNGKPRPPLRIMAPSGAPIKNIRMHAKAITNLS